MSANIEFKVEPHNERKANTYNYLGKAFTAISAPLFVLSAYSLVASAINTDKPNPSNGAISNPYKVPVHLSLMASVLLASIGSSYRRRYIESSNMRQTFVTDESKLEYALEQIDHTKNHMIKSGSSSGDYNYFNDRVAKGEDVMLPSLSKHDDLHIYLFMSTDEIENLSAERKVKAYLAQNICMDSMIKENEYPKYHPQIQLELGMKHHNYDNMLTALKEDHAKLSEEFYSKYAGFNFEIQETVNEINVKEAAKKEIPDPGCSTFALTMIIPAVPALTENFSALRKNFAAKPVHFKDDNINLLDKIKEEAVAMCTGEVSAHHNYSFSDFRKVNVTLAGSPKVA